MTYYERYNLCDKKCCDKCVFYRNNNGNGTPLCLSPINVRGGVFALLSKRVNLSDVRRKEFETILWNYLKADPSHHLEAFVDMEFTAKTSDKMWKKAYTKIKNMSNIELQGIILNLQNEDMFEDWNVIFNTK